MILYDKDDKLLCASDKQIRLWDFYDHKEEAPELITACECPLVIENVFVNKNSENSYSKKEVVMGKTKETKGQFYCLVTNQDQYALYKDRMDLVRTGNTHAWGDEHITCAEFNKDSTCFWIATNKGNIIKMSTATGDQVGKLFNVSPEIGRPITKMERFHGIQD